MFTEKGVVSPPAFFDGLVFYKILACSFIPPYDAVEDNDKYTNRYEIWAETYDVCGSYVVSLKQACLTGRGEGGRDIPRASKPVRTYVCENERARPSSPPPGAHFHFPTF